MPAIGTGRESTNAQPAKPKLKKGVKKTVNVRPPDRADDRAVVRAQQLARSVPKTPDQADRKRAPVQKARDARVVATNVRVATAGARENQKSVDDAGPVRLLPKYAKMREAGKKKQAVRLAPVLNVLDQTTRPLHAVAGATDAAVQGKNVPRAALRGIQNKDKTTFSDVLEHAGVKNKYVRAIAGTTLDVVADPSTYVTGGTASVARKAATIAATKAEKAALKKGLTAEQARKFGERAAAQAEKTGDQTKGVTVKFAGKELPGVRKTTAKASKPVRAAGRKVTPQKLRDNSRAVLADVNPDVAPTGVSKATSRAAVQATRTARAKSNRGLHEAQQQAVGIKAQVGEANYSRIIDAIEGGTIGSLPDDLARVAVRVRSQFRHANRLRKQAGIRGGEIKARPKVKVPEVTANPQQSAKDLSRATRREIAARRELADLRDELNVNQGRAEVLSRNVSGARGEKAAERAAKLRRSAGSRAGQRGAAKDVLKYIDRIESGQKYAGGGIGVSRAQAILHEAEQHASSRGRQLTHAQETHVAEKTAAAEQRAARTKALKVAEKREKAPKGYIPHKLTDEALAESGKQAGGVGRKVVRPSSSRARSDNRPLAALRQESPGKYSEDLPALYANRKAEGATAVARAELNRRIADLGRNVKKGQDLTLEKGESVYHVVGSDLRKVSDKKELGALVDKGGKKGRYVVLNDDIVKRAIEGSQPTLQGPGIVRGLDKTQAGFKRIALATPGFHLRNLVGDTQNAYLGQGGHRLPGNMRRAAKILRAEGRQDRALRTLDKVPDKTATLKTPKYGNVTYEEIARQLTKHGGMRSGFTAREIPELAGEKATVGRVRLPRKAKQALLNREDLPRLTTAVDALRKGASWEEAAQKVSEFHFDYGHLTHFERQIARRAAPFYTFSARNIPLQVKSLVTKPGKYANYQKVREEAGKLTGMDEESKKARDLTEKLKAAGVKLPDRWEASLSEWEQRNAGVPISWKGHKFTVSMGLPLADLNEFPGASLSSQLTEYYQKAGSLATPVAKDIVEYMENHSFFFRDDIERPFSPLVAAPSWVKSLPKGLQEKMGVTPNFIDKKTGKKGWGYRAKADYVVKAIPGTPAFLNKMATDGHDRVGKGKAGKTLAFVGVKATPYDPITNAVNLAYERNQEIGKKMAALRQQTHPKNDQPISAKNPTPEYSRLNAQLKLTQEIAYQGRLRSGYKKLPTQGGPPKLKASSSGRVKVPGVSGRVKVPGVGGRVKVPGG